MNNMIEDLSVFELAGYTKEESDKLIKICYERGMDCNQVLAFLKSFDVHSDEVFRQLTEYGKSPLEIAWDRLIESVAESLRVYKILDWLNERICKVLDWLNKSDKSV